MNSETLLLRQAHPNFVKDNLVTSQAFVPFPKDGGLLSVYDGEQVSALDSYRHFTQVLKNQSHSVWAVTKREADDAGTPGIADSLPENPAHTAIDFRGVPESSWRKIAKRLKAAAIDRGCQYRPPS